MEGDPKLNDDHILHETVKGLNEVSSMELVQAAKLVQWAPKFTKKEVLLLSVFMIAKSQRLTYIELLNLMKQDGKSTAVEDNEIVGAVKQLIDMGIVEEKESRESSSTLKITEIGEIIFKMWAIAGKLLEEHEISKI